MRPRSFRSIQSAVTRLSERAGSEDLRALDAGAVREFLYWGREELCWEARTFRNQRIYLRSFFAWCVAEGYLDKNPVDGIASPKLPRKLPRALARQDLMRVLSEVRWVPWRYAFEQTRNETILYFLAFTGLRLQEMLDLELGDIDLMSRELWVRQGKGNKDRLVPIHPRLVVVLRRYLQERKARGRSGPFVFVGAQSDKPLSGKNVRTVCQKVSAHTGIKFTPHMLRHTFAKLSLEAGIDVFQVKEMMGHTDISTTQNYLSISTEALKRDFCEVSLL